MAGNLDDNLESNLNTNMSLEDVWARVLGKNKIRPDSVEFELNSNLINELTRNLNHLIRILFNELGTLSKQKNMGSFNQEIYCAKWKGKEVILKFPIQKLANLTLTLPL